MARLVRREDTSFVAITVEAETGSEVRSNVGVFIGKANEEPAMLLYRDASGSANVFVAGVGRPIRLGNKIRPGKFSVGIGVIDRKRGRFTIIINGRSARGRRIYTIPQLAGAETLDAALPDRFDLAAEPCLRANRRGISLEEPPLDHLMLAPSFNASPLGGEFTEPQHRSGKS